MTPSRKRAGRASSPKRARRTVRRSGQRNGTKAPRKPRSKPAGKAPPPASPSAHILLVDDDPVVLASLKSYLRSFLPGTKVLTAKSATAALATLAKTPVDVAFIDYRMDGMNGLQLLRSLRQSSPATARILMTAYPDMQLAMDALNQANARFLVKPLQPAQVLQAAVAALEERGVLGALTGRRRKA